MVGTVFFCLYVISVENGSFGLIPPRGGWGDSKKIYYTVRAEKSATKVFYSEKKSFLCTCKIGKPDW